MADQLVFDDRGYILSTGETAGGRGINASRLLHSFGVRTLAVVTAGGQTGDRFDKLLRESGYAVEVVRIAHEIRTNLTISDRRGLTIKLNEAGPEITDEELARVQRAIEAKLKRARWLMICGSVPPGVDPKFYGKLVALARSRNVPTLVDTDGEALLHAMEEGPTIVTPNQQEAERLLNRALITRSHFLEAVERLHAMGPESVVMSLGARGAVARNAAGTFEILPPRVDVASPIGSGDVLAAAFVWAALRKRPFAEAVRWGVAAGTASARLPGLEFASLEQTKALYRQVEIRPA